MKERLLAITPIDGRYSDKLSELSEIFSEYGIIKRRVDIEVEYFIFLSSFIPQLSSVTTRNIDDLRGVSKDFNIDEARVVKEIEATTKHDVKAVEYYLRTKFDELDMSDYKSFIHFGLTSEDVNSVVYVLQLWDFRSSVYSEWIHKIIGVFEEFGALYKDVPMLSRTHGQSATPTTVGKEFLVYKERVSQQYNYLRKMNFKTKFGGAVGKMNAHVIAYPHIDWNMKMDTFITHYAHRRGFMMKRNRYTTQIDHYENYGVIFDIIKRINTILIDFCVDMWLYISYDYFKLSVVKGEVGSSAMPHKVNPIMFENAEGNLLLANNLLNFMSMRLPISRLQRDLSGSTILRNMGVAFSHTILSYKNIISGMGRVTLDKARVLHDLESNPVIISEGIQSILRSHGYEDAYETVKEITRGGRVDIGILHKFIHNLDIDKGIKDRLLRLTPINYIGI